MTTPDDHQDHGEGPEERPAPETAESRRGRYIGVGVALGMGLGIAVGTPLALLLFDNIVFGVLVGSLGMVIGAAVGSQRAAAAEQAEAGEGPAQPENGSTR